MDHYDLPEHYPQGYSIQGRLKDGRPVTIRPILPSDAPGLQRAFLRLTPETIYLRFLETFKALSDRRADEFANVDYSIRMAFVGEVEEQDARYIIGVARYALVGEERPGLAEAAIVVVDEHQRLGLGTLLMGSLLRYAWAHGVTGILATIHVSNIKIMQFINRRGLPFRKTMLEPGVWEVIVDLTSLDAHLPA